MKKIFTILLILCFPLICLATPSNSISFPNSFSPNTVISSSATNANNNEAGTKYNAHTHTDITQTGTITSGAWNGTAISTTYGGTGQNFSATAQGNIPYFSVAGTISALAPGTSGYFLKTQGAAANPIWAAIPADMAYADTRYKLTTFTRDLTAVAGDVSYTGVGFTPKQVSFIYSSTANCTGSGFDDGTIHYSAGAYGSVTGGFNAVSSGSASIVGYLASDGSAQSAIVKTFDADGFTLTWAKTGTPNGILNIFVRSYR